MAESVITADDVIRAGACPDGVYEFLEAHAEFVTAAMPARAVLALCEQQERSHVEAAIDLSGDGYGYGFGFGSGDGSGFGDGDGSGYGFGYGYGFGSGYGYGFGDGYGSGA